MNVKVGPELGVKVQGGNLALVFHILLEERCDFQHFVSRAALKEITNSRA